MVRVNCGAIPTSLVENTLFGHDRGAFTGAVQRQRGVFEEADQGTVFLDEIGELPLEAQAALLRVLETGSFSRVGSPRELTVDVRVIAATHRDLQAMVEEGDFREDLFYRLSTMELEIPPLRERPDEMDRFVGLFISQANKANGRSVRGVAKEAMALLRAHPWPGNVRELRNAVERAVVMARSDWIEPEDLPPRVRATRTEAAVPAETTASGASLGGEVKALTEQIEAQRIEDALQKTGWTRAKAAKLLGMPIRTLSRKINKYGLNSPRR
jgi:DNA-binding NtrC family response regulator